jgi:hypothetical protein
MLANIAVFSGGLIYLDLRSGKGLKNLIDRLSEGVFTVICDFSKVFFDMRTFDLKNYF